MRKGRSRLLGRGLAIWLLAVAVAAPGVTSAGEDSGVGVITAKDVAHRTVTIDGRVYRLSDHTRLEGRDGHAITVEQLPVVRSDVDGGIGLVQGSASFEARRGPEGLELESLRLVETPR